MHVIRCTLTPILRTAAFLGLAFGTLQNEKKEVVIEYGITRPVNTRSFIDMYFGECIWLVKDVRSGNWLAQQNKLMLMRRAGHPAMMNTPPV